MVNYSRDFLLASTDGCNPSQLAVLQFPEIVDKILSLGFDSDTIFNLAQHPDSKLYFPVAKFQEIYEREIKNEVISSNSFFRITSIYSLVCDTDSSNAVKLTKQYTNSLCWHIHGTFAGISGYSLYELVMPLVNLSVNNHNKEILGESEISKLMLETIQVKPNADFDSRVTNKLLLSRQLAAKVPLISLT